MTEEEQQEILLAHARNVSLRGSLPAPAKTASQNNPLCGDAVSFSILLAGDRIEEVRTESQGCFICRASSSILAAGLKNRSVNEGREIAQSFRKLMHGEEANPILVKGDFLSLAGIRKYPLRIKCALLPFDVVESLLNSETGDS